MLEIRHGMILTKLQAWMLESGRRGITRQVEGMGLKPVVVGRDGRGYDKHEWHASNTFRRGTQGNLLIADNQTRKYASAGPAEKRAAERFAWGEAASESRADIAAIL
jgi:hypothetical protein